MRSVLHATSLQVEESDGDEEKIKGEMTMPKFYHAEDGSEIESAICPPGYGLRRRLQVSDAMPYYYRSGYQFHHGIDDAALDERTLAHQEMCRTISNAWKHPPAQPSSHPQMAHDATNSQHSVASMADANDREAAYQEYLAWLNDAWRGTAK
jgi:hypothetical protein